jgi:hypothetical protein
MLMNDDYVVEQRIDALQRLPWPISSRTVLDMTSEDLDILAAVRHDDNAYWRVLNGIVSRIESARTSEAGGEKR